MVGEILDLGSDFWLRDRLKSGQEIDRLRGQNIPFNSRVIDRTDGISCVVSHKSTNLLCLSYQSPRAVYRLGMSFVRDLAAYQGEVRRNRKIKATYFLSWALQGPNPRRILEWFVPYSGVTGGQEEALELVVSEALALGVEVRVFRV